MVNRASCPGQTVIAGVMSASTGKGPSAGGGRFRSARVGGQVDHQLRDRPGGPRPFGVAVGMAGAAVTGTQRQLVAAAAHALPPLAPLAPGLARTAAKTRVPTAGHPGFAVAALARSESRVGDLRGGEQAGAQENQADHIAELRQVPQQRPGGQLGAAAGG